jgi:hypothetical protein
MAYRHIDHSDRLYHGTIRLYLASIREHGLLPQGGSHALFLFPWSCGVGLTPDLAVAQKYAKMVTEHLRYQLSYGPHAYLVRGQTGTEMILCVQPCVELLVDVGQAHLAHQGTVPPTQICVHRSNERCIPLNKPER